MSPAVATTLHVLAVVLSMVMLWKGADWVVEGASRVARRLNVSELVIGLTLVAAGTSAPEFAVSIGAALSDQADISVSNVVGSNIFNLGFILGGCAAIRPILTSRPLVRRDGVVLIAITVALAIFLADARLERWEGGSMVAVLVGYLALLWWRRAPVELIDEAEIPEAPPAESSLVVDLLRFGAGLVGVAAGARFLIYGASGLAISFGLSNWTIGVTIVAAGTSAPELVTSLTAVLKGRHGISAGGLIGSDIYNLLGVLGVASLIRPLAIAPGAITSILLLVGMVVLAVIFMRSGWRVSRLEGLALVAISAVRWWFDFT